jgi:hypothetical protein
MKRLFSLAFLTLLICSCSLTTRCGDDQDTSCTRVLFIGNSYTFVNDLPDTFANLARSDGNKVEVGMSAQGGWTLSEHLQSAETLDLLNSKKWKFVVLQEQSQIPSVVSARTQGMYPAARELVQKIQAIGATPIFFVTWAHRGGWPEYGMNNYESMQAQINDGYTQIAQELKAPIAPVGVAWLSAVSQYPDLMLWQADGSHPAEQGTYLAACVFYAVIFHESPNGLSYRADLPKEKARILQSVASSTVLNIP